MRPNTASVVCNIDRYKWKDSAWLEARASRDWLHAPMSIYEIHAGAWRRKTDDGNRWLTYRELADELIPYVKRMGLHAHRIDAHHGASVRRFLGLSDRRLFRRHQPLRHAGRFHVFRRPLPSGRPRRDSRLDSRAFPARRPRPGLLRRHPSLRTRRSAPRRASGLGHARLQLRPQRSAEFPPLQRALLGRQVSHRRPARGRRRFHALSRLLAPRRRMDSQCFRRTRKSGSHRLHQAPQ